MQIDRINQEYCDWIQEHYEENREGAIRMQEYLDRTPLYYKDHCFSKILQIPKIYTEEIAEDFSRIVTVTYRIFEKVIQEYLHCEDYRALFPFSKELEELILTPNLYQSVLPIARFDIFYQEDTSDFYFCEINTDGTSAMNEDRILNESLLLNPAHQHMLQKYTMRSFELFDSWVETFLSLYRTYEKADAGKLPQVAIVDFLEQGTIREFEEFARRFQKAGMLCEVCDIQELEYRDGVLYSPDGMRIDAIYRRAVTSDIMKSYDKVQPFIQAVLDQNVFLAGSFTTQIIHNKWLFHVLHLERTRQFLTKEEWAFVKKHIPDTRLLEKDKIVLQQLIEKKNEYIIKPLDSYASNGVFAGVDYTDKEWEQIVKEHMDCQYICQKYCPQYRTKNIDFINGDGQLKDYINMAGLYVYNGEFAGVFSRLSDGGIIASHGNERSAPTLVVTGER
ncbi:MAG: hypothetical protein SO170_09155 [Butyribacter sp.]|nr:hypothetical protein [bacterium]MDY3855102.1 hypothetical protein [Butyribacter sp.]